MYVPGRLIFFDPFFFKDGGSKPKYFLVLKVIDSTAILASLPSSQSHLPATQEIKHGCLELPESCINCYIFEAKTPVTKSGWSFPLHTFMHGLWLDDFLIEDLQANYPIENVDYEVIGELLDDELDKIISENYFMEKLLCCTTMIFVNFN